MKLKLNPSEKKKKNIELTPSVIIGLLIGLILIAGGLYRVFAHGGYEGYYGAAMGILFIGLIFAVLWSRNT